jgi:hypothetical protein
MGYDRDRDDRFRGRGEEENRWQGNRHEREGGSFGNWGPNRHRGEWEDVSGSSGSGDVRWERSSQGQFRGDPVHYRGGGGGAEPRGGGFPDRERGRETFGSNYGGQGGEDRYASGGSGGGGGGSGGSMAGDYDVGSGGPADTWGGSGFGGDYDRGRRFDRIDAGSTGTHGAHPMSAPVGGGYGGYGVGGGYGGGGSSAREAAIIRNAQQQQGGQGQNPRGQGGGQSFGGGQQFGVNHDPHHDRHYSEWRQRQIEELDRDYHEYRQEHQSRFENEFGGWRQKRQSQRQLMGRVTEHMEVLGSDGQHIGTVDKVRGDRIILTKNDENAGGIHHSIPCSWVETVEDKVTVNKSAAEAMAAWTNEDQNRALFERSDQGSDGPHILNRSFSNTYDEKKD